MMKITLLTVFFLLSYNCFSNEIENLEKSIDKLNKATVDYGNINNIILEEILKKGSISPEKARIIIRKLEKINKKIFIKNNSSLTSNLPILKAEEKNKLSLTSNLPMLMIEETNNVKNVFSLNLTSFEEGDIANGLGEGLIVLKTNNKKNISGRQSDPKGVLEIIDLNLKEKFRIDMISGINSSFIEFILKAKYDDIENEIKIKMDGRYIYLSDKSTLSFKKNSSEKEWNINNFTLYKKKNVIKFYMNGNYLYSKKSDENIVYDKLIIKNIDPKDHIYDLLGYNYIN